MRVNSNIKMAKSPENSASVLIFRAFLVVIIEFQNLLEVKIRIIILEKFYE